MEVGTSAEIWVIFVQSVPVGSVNRLNSHMINVHALLFERMFTCPVVCSQDDCKRTFRYSTALKRHIEKLHKPVDDDPEEHDHEIIPGNVSEEGEMRRVTL